jgi:hypothetical protein
MIHIVNKNKIWNLKSPPSKIKSKELLKIIKNIIKHIEMLKLHSFKLKLNGCKRKINYFKN